MSVEPVTVYLGLGSNMRNRQENLSKAISLLSQRLQIGLISSLYDTEPVGNIDQPRFLNLVCQVYTQLAPEALLVLVKGIEVNLGRVPAEPNTPRPIDIDILFYSNRIVKTEKLEIPHPRLTERAFVLVPLAEIAPDLVHPVSHRTIRELLEVVNGKQGVLRWNKSGEV